MKDNENKQIMQSLQRNKDDRTQIQQGCGKNQKPLFDPSVNSSLTVSSETTAND